jgi:hypothetical protein
MSLEEEVEVHMRTIAEPTPAFQLFVKRRENPPCHVHMSHSQKLQGHKPVLLQNTKH